MAWPDYYLLSFELGFRHMPLHFRAFETAIYQVQHPTANLFLKPE